jgi:hypothetical protein
MQQQANGIMGAMANKQGNSADASLGGMAKAVDTKVEAYRNNPQALEKRLAGNQQLLDLLALQKVKSEKESAANQLLLSEQQVPSTILEQREQEVLAMNKNDIAKQTAGILGQRQKKAEQKQRAMGMPPQQGQRPPMPQGAPQGAPMMAARGGLLPLPRPNMQGMAQGGIMGYANGGAVDKVKAFIAQRGGKLNQQEMEDLVNASKNDSEIIAFLKQDQGYISNSENADIDVAANDQTTPLTPREERNKIRAAERAERNERQKELIAGIPNIGANAREKRQTDYDAYKKAEALKTLGGQAPVVEEKASLSNTSDVEVPANIPKEAVVKEMPSGLSKLVGSAVDWAKENPVEAVGLGMMFIPGLGWAANGALRAASLGMKAYNAAKKVDYAKKLTQAAKVAKETPSKFVSRPPKLPTRDAKGRITAQGEAGRQYSKGRTAATGAGIMGLGKAKGAFDQSISDGVDASIAEVEAQQKAQQEAEYQTGLGNIMTGMQAEQDQRDDENLTVTPDPKSIGDQARDIVTTPPSAVARASAAATADPFATIKEKATKDMNVNVLDGANAAAKRSDENLNRTGVAKTMQGGIDSLRNMTTAAQDPDKLRLDRQKAMFAAAGRGGLQGIMDMEIMQDRQEQQFGFSKLREATDRENEKIKADIDIGRIGQTAANAVFGALTKSSTDAMNILSNISISEIQQAAKKAADLVVENRARINSELEVLNLTNSAKRNKILEQGNAQTMALEMSKLAKEMLLDIREIAANDDRGGAELFEKNERYKAKNNGMDKPDFNDQEAAALAIYISYVEEIAKRSEEYQKTLQTLTDITGKGSKSGTFGQ